MLSEAKKRADKKYASKLKNTTIKLNPDIDMAVIEKLDSVPNKTDYIRQLILRDLGLEQA